MWTLRFCNLFYAMSTLNATLDSMGKIVRLLLQRGADPDARDHKGWSPVMSATWLGREAWGRCSKPMGSM